MRTSQALLQNVSKEIVWNLSQSQKGQLFVAEYTIATQFNNAPNLFCTSHSPYFWISFLKERTRNVEVQG